MSKTKRLYFEVGTVIELNDGSKARVTENADYMRCFPCVFSELLCGAIACAPDHRKDGKNIYFEQVREGGKA